MGTAPEAFDGSIEESTRMTDALHSSVLFSHFFALDCPHRQLVGGRKGVSAHEQGAEQGGWPGGSKQHSDDNKR